MFYYISGKLAHLESGFAVVEANGGVGYKLSITGTTYDSMPPRHTVSEPPAVKLFTYMSVREDGIELFGFATESELSAFKMLISVSGVGPKAAISILSFLTPEKLALAVCSEDTKTISRANGVGAKTAARIVLELKDKMLKETPSEISMTSRGNSAVGTMSTDNSLSSKGKLSEAQDALIVLGYSRSEALSAINGLDIERMELEHIIREALKKLMR